MTMTDSSSTNTSLGELEETIKLALKRTGSLKELDLCAYLSDGNRALLPSTYLRLKDTNKETLMNLIKVNILDADKDEPHHSAPQPRLYAGKSLEECLKEAMSKVNVLRETALCKYIPADEGYLHHFTFLKMKSTNPIQLRNLIKEHILERTPALVTPKKRKRRKHNDQPCGFEALPKTRTRNLDALIEPPYKEQETKTVEDKENSKMDQLLNLMNQLVQTLQHSENFASKSDVSPTKYEDTLDNQRHRDRYLQVIQNQLIRKIRLRQVDYELWDVFVDFVANSQ